MDINADTNKPNAKGAKCMKNESCGVKYEATMTNIITVKFLIFIPFGALKTFHI